MHTHVPKHMCPHVCAKYTPKCQQCLSLMVNIRMIFKTVFLDTDIKNRLWDTVGEEKDGMISENDAETYTLPCVR